MNEDMEQEKLVNWCKINKIFCFSVPNGAFLAGTQKSRTIQMQKLKKTGLVVGASDLIVLLDNKALFIELKVAKKKLKNGNLSTSNSKVSNAQRLFYNRIKEFSYAEPFIAYGADEAIEFIKEYK